MGSFGSEYKKLKDRREEDQKGRGTNVTAAGNVGGGFAQQYLALRKKREDGLQGLSLPSPPETHQLASAQRSQGQDQLKFRQTVRPPALPTQPEPYTGPDWAREMAGRYKPSGVQGGMKNPVAQWEERKRMQAQARGTGTSILGRVGTMVSGAAKTYGASLANTEASLYDLTQGGRDAMNRELLEGAQLKYEQALRDYQETEELAQRYPEKYQKDLEASRNMLEAAERELAAYGAAPELQRSAAQGAYKVSDQLAESGQADVERAKAGLGGLGRFAVDVGVGGVQLGADIAGGIVTGGGTMVPLLLRSYGGGAQEARQEGAGAGQAAAYGAASALTEVLTEKISSLGNIQTKAFGAGALDDILEGVVGAVERVGKTEAGRAALNRAASAGVGFLSEGAEEFVSGIVSPLMKRAIYSDESINWKETMEEAAYEFLVGGGIGAVSGGLGGTSTGDVQSQYLAGATDRAQNDAYRTMAEKGMFSREAGKAAQDALGQMDKAWERSGLSLPTLEDMRRAGEIAAEGPEEQGDIRIQPGGGSKENGPEAHTRLMGGFSQGINGGGVSKAEWRLLDNLGKITGSDIRVVSQEELDRTTGRAGADGVQIGNRLYISEAAERPVLEVARHELTHRLQDIAPAEYGAFRDYVAGLYHMDGKLESYIETTRNSRALAGMELTEAEALDEIAADFAGLLLVDEKAVRRLAGENRGLLERLLDGLREIIGKIKRAFGGRADGQTAELEQAARLWEDALRSAGENTGAGPEGLRLRAMDDPMPRFSFGGRNARRADSGSLVRAQIQESAGMTAEDIRRDTGWFRGMDGLWRFEIDDSGMEYSQWGDMRQPGREKQARFRELELKFIEGRITEAEQAELRSLADKGYGNGGSAAQEELRLADYIRHDELFRNYPQLKGARLRFTEMEPGTQGGYNPKTNTITVSEKLRAAPDDTILHEIQHAIQKAEGFARGANWVYWNQRMEDGYAPPQEKARRARVEAALKNIREIEGDAPRDFLVKLREFQYLENYTASEKGMADAEAWDRAAALQEELENQYGDLFQKWYDADWERQMAEGSETVITPGDLYRNTAGEIEARDAVSRRNLTEEERRNTPPDLGDKNTVFAEDSGESAFIGYDRNNRPFVTVEEDILEGVPREDWVRTVKDNLRKKFPDGVTVGNSVIRINDQSRREMTFSKYMQRLFNTNPEIHADKLRATDNVDEILKATTGWINEAPLHQRTDDIADFARGEVLLRIGKNEYTADVVVGNRGENGLLLYDIINLAPTTIRDRTKKSGTVYTANTQNELRSRGPVPDEYSIPRSSPDVKPMRTFSDEVMAQLAGERGDGSDSDTSREAPHSGAYSAKPSEGRPTGNSRFSMKGDADIQREFERLRRQNRRLREQMTRTDRAKMNREAVDLQAREILKEYGSKYDRAALGERLEKLYGGIANQALSESDMRSEARSIAKDILAENQKQINGLYEEYQGLRKELRTRGISIAPEYQADLESAGGYEGLRKRYFGRLRLSKDGAAMDQVYDDLSSRYPELFPDSILHPADQLLRLTEVLDDLRPVMGNAYEGGMDQAAEYLAGELLERFYDTPEKVPTFADRQARKLAEQRAADRRQMLEAVAKERDKKETALRDLREKYREAERKRIENQSASQRRESIRRHADRLGRMLLRPTDKRHVPEDLRGAALELVRQIDTGSNYFLDPDTGKRVYARDGNQIDMESPGQVQTRRTAAARELQAQYEKLAAEGGYTVDPDMAGYLDKLANMGGKTLGDMSKAELDTVWKVIRVIEHCISKSDELLGRSRYATVSEMAERLREDADELPRRRQWVQPLGMIDGGLNLDMLTPETYFHKLGEAGDDLFRQMRRAQDQQVTIQKDVLDKFQKAYEESGQKAWSLEKELHSFDVSGGEVALTTAQIMELYALSKREQAIGHLYTGGIRPEAVRGKGLKLEGGGRAVAITPEDAAQIIGALTKEQRALADRMQDILSKELSAYGNEASMEVYGYEKFKEKNYWPIKIGSEDTRTDPAAKASSRTIPGYGMTKTVQPDAKNPVVLHSAFDTFARHVAEMSTYAGWLGTNENAVRLLNYQFQDADGNRDGTIKDRLKHIHGAGGTAYMEKLLGDIALGTKAGKDTIFSSGGMTSAFKSSAISANLRVILQQPTAILRAMEMVSPKYFLTVLGQKDLMKGWETAKKYSPIAQWKDWGYFEIDTGRSYKEMMLEPKNLLDRTKGALMYPAGAADALGWGYLWKIVEAETADKRRDLKKGGEDFYRKTAERFGEIVDRTQVVDSVLHRTQMMRSEKDVHKMASSFMSEPSKQYNEVIRGLYDFTRAQGKKDGEGRKKAVGRLVRTAAAMSLSFAVNALAQSLPDMWRDHDRDRSNSEKFWDSWQENFRSNYNPLGYVPYLKDFWSVIDSTLLKKRAFGGEVSRMDMEVVTDIAKAAKQAVDVYNGEGKKSRANAYFDAAAQLCRAAGLPLATMKKDAIGIAGWWMQATGNNEGLYQLDKMLYEEGNDAQRFTAHLHRAMNADWDQYESIYQDMSKNWEQYGGEADWTEEKFREKIQGSMEKRMAEEAGLEKASSLPVEYSVPGEDLTFDQEVMRQLTGGKTWKDSLPDGTLELARDIDHLKPEKDAGSVTSMQKIREVRDSIWGSDVKDLTLKNILGEKDYDRLQEARKAGVSIEKWCRLYEDIADEKIRRTGKRGSPSQEDVANALEGSGLSERQKDAIWSGYWNSERPGAGTTEGGARLTGLSLPGVW